jgi:DNA polymerase-1
LAEKRKYLLLDGHSLAYRAFFALPPTMTTTGGQPVNAVYGFTSMLLKVLDEEKPDAVIVALDGPRADLSRTREFPEYKAQRPPMPEDLRGQIEMIGHLLGHMRIPVVTARGFEADDILATIAVQVAERGEEAVIVTGDRDTLQVVRPGVRVLMTGKGITDTVSYGPDTVVEKYGVLPDQLPDIAGLKGDASDNIPGVRDPREPVRTPGRYRRRQKKERAGGEPRHSFPLQEACGAGHAGAAHTRPGRGPVCRLG